MTKYTSFYLSRVMPFENKKKWFPEFCSITNYKLCDVFNQSET